MGGGAAFFDYDHDGFEDLFITGGVRKNSLYKNLGDKTFANVSALAGIEDLDLVSSSGVALGDFNNDGCDDLFLTTFDRFTNRLLINNCDGTFSDLSGEAGITHISNSTGAAVLDINNDGFLDIYVINYVENARFIMDSEGRVIGFDHDCYPNLLYINQGDGSFSEQAEAFGVANLGCGLAVAATDLDEDGFTDLYIANDFGQWIEPNAAYLNLDPGAPLLPVEPAAGLNSAIFGMGIAIGDLDDNGRKDYYVTNLGPNHFLSQDAPMRFSERAEEFGIENETVNGQNVTGWGTFFFDVDHDTDLDLFVANGSVSTLPFLNTVQQDPDRLFINQGIGMFSQSPSFDEVSSDQSNRGAVYADYDLDGDLDIFSVAVDISDGQHVHSSFYENLNETGNWVSLKLVGSEINKNAFGAKTIIFAGNKSLERELYNSGTYASQSSQFLHFGLGNHALIDSIQVYWGGAHAVETFYELPANQRIRLVQASETYEIMGCTDPENAYYNPLATYNDACWNPKLRGCTDPASPLFNPESIVDDGTCDDLVLSTDEEREESLAISVYPNPFTDAFVIASKWPLSHKQVQILNLAGRSVSNFKVSIIPNGISIDMHELASGVYFLRIESLFEKGAFKTIPVIKH